MTQHSQLVWRVEETPEELHDLLALLEEEYPVFSSGRGLKFRRVAEEIACGKGQSAYCPPRATLDTMKLLDTCRRQLGLVYPSERRGATFLPE